MGSVFIKLTARILKARIQAFVNDLLRFVQRGEGTSNGVVSCVFFANAMFELHPDFIAADYDFANAFNTVLRSLFFSKLFSCADLKPIWRFVDMLYRDESELFLFSEGKLAAEFQSSQGTRQGCVLGTLLFCLSTIDLLKDGIAATGVNLVSVADDVKAFGTQEQIYAFTTWLAHHLRAHTGLSLRLPKVSFYYPNAAVKPNQDMLTLSKVLGIDIISGGCWKMFGAAVGIDSSAKQRFVMDKVNEALGWDGSDYHLLKKLESDAIPAQVAFHIIRGGICPKLMHLWRCFPLREVEQASVHFVQIINCFIARKLVIKPDTVDHTQRLWLPGDLGGLSLQHPHHISRGAYLAGVAASMELFVEAQVKADAPKWIPPKPDELHAFMKIAETRPFALMPFNVGAAQIEFVSFADRLFDRALPPLSPTFELVDAVSPASPTIAYNVATALMELKAMGVMDKVNQKDGILPDTWDRVVPLLSEPPNNLQNLLYRAVASRHYQEKLSRFGPDSRQGRLLRASSEPFTHYWATQLCSSEESRMSDIEFRLAYALRFDISPYHDLGLDGPPLRCKHHRCYAIDLRFDPFHELHCPGESKMGKDTQHNRQLNHYFDLAQLCNVQTERSSKKYAGIDPKDPSKRNNQRPDLVAHFGNGSVLADVRGLDPLCKSALELPLGKYAEYAGNAKVSKYSLIADREQFEPVTPLVFTTLGGIDRRALAFIDRIVRNFKGHYTAKIKVKYQKITEMVVGIMKDNARMIQRAFSRA